jgi:hypothetical protein
VSVLFGLVCLIGVAPSAVSPATVKVSPKVATAVSRHSPKANGGAALMTVDPARTGGIAPDVLELAVGAVSCAVNSGDIEKPRTLTVIDYSSAVDDAAVVGV